MQRSLTFPRHPRTICVSQRVDYLQFVEILSEKHSVLIGQRDLRVENEHICDWPEPDLDAENVILHGRRE